MAKLTGVTQRQMRMEKLSETIILKTMCTHHAAKIESEDFSLKHFAHTCNLYSFLIMH